MLIVETFGRASAPRGPPFGLAQAQDLRHITGKWSRP